MQLGIRGASGDAWAPTPRSRTVTPPASVYDVADAIAAAAKYLTAHGVQQNVPRGDLRLQPRRLVRPGGALLGVGKYASGGCTISEVTPNGDGTADDSVLSSTTCKEDSELASLVAGSAILASAVNYAEDQLGKPYLFGERAQAALDCLGLVMMALQVRQRPDPAHLPGAVEAPAARPRLQGAPR